MDNTELFFGFLVRYQGLIEQETSSNNQPFLPIISSLEQNLGKIGGIKILRSINKASTILFENKLRIYHLLST